MDAPTLDVVPDARLTSLVEEVERLAGTAGPVGGPDEAIAYAAVATLQLDGSPITRPVPLDAVPPPPGTATGPARGTP